MTRRRKILLGLAILAAALVVGFVLFSRWWNPRIEVTLSDGRTVVCERVVQGKKISQSEFEDDVYEYPEWVGWSRERRLDQLLRRLLFWKPAPAERTVYVSSPELLCARVGRANGSELYARVTDSFGNRGNLPWPTNEWGPAATFLPRAATE